MECRKGYDEGSAGKGVNVIISARRVEDVQKNDNDIKPVDKVVNTQRKN